MTREEWAARLPIIQAFVERKTIQVKWEDGPDDSWGDLDIFDNINFFTDGLEYRIKPEPKVIWVNTSKSVILGAFSTHEEAYDQVGEKISKGVVIKTSKYVEVVE